jgi:hypothetical protein
MKPLANDSRVPRLIGIVRATTLPPFARARSPAASLAAFSSRLNGETAMTFQLMGRWAATDMSTMRSMAHWSNGPTWGMISSEVPGYSPTTRARSTSSASVAWRDGTMLPSASLWVRAYDDENPMPPASSPARNRSCIRPISSGVASRRVASAPMTTRRSAECPTMKPRLIPTPADSMRSK